MTGKRLLEIGIVSAIAGLLGTGLSDWLSNRSDAAWWQVGPWILLVALWAVLGLQLGRLRSHRRQSNGFQ
jgi:hypothetical protein